MKSTTTKNYNLPKIIEFHDITEKPTWRITSLKIQKFIKIIEVLRSSFQIREPSKFLQEKNGIIISFDDALYDIYKYAYPILEKNNVKATIAVICGYIGKVNRWDLWGGENLHMGGKEIKELVNKGWMPLSHSMTHRDLTKLSDKILEEELVLSKKILEDLVGREVEGIVYPFGRYDKRVVMKAMEVGYRFGLAAAVVAKEKKIPWYMQIPRIPFYSIDPIFMIKKKIKNGILKKIDEKKNILINKISLFTVFFKRKTLRFSPLQVLQDF